MSKKTKSFIYQLLSFAVLFLPLQVASFNFYKFNWILDSVNSFCCWNNFSTKISSYQYKRW